MSDNSNYSISKNSSSPQTKATKKSSTSSFINRLITRTSSTAVSTFNSPATTTTTTTTITTGTGTSFPIPIPIPIPFPAPTPPSAKKLRTGFSVERIYEFEAPQFYDFTKQSDPERGHLDEHWFGNFNFII